MAIHAYKIPASLEAISSSFEAARITPLPEQGRRMGFPGKTRASIRTATELMRGFAESPADSYSSSKCPMRFFFVLR